MALLTVRLIHETDDAQEWQQDFPRVGYHPTYRGDNEVYLCRSLRESRRSGPGLALLPFRLWKPNRRTKKRHQLRRGPQLPDRKWDCWVRALGASCLFDPIITFKQRRYSKQKRKLCTVCPTLLLQAFVRWSDEESEDNSSTTDVRAAVFIQLFILQPDTFEAIFLFLRGRRKFGCPRVKKIFNHVSHDKSTCKPWIPRRPPARRRRLAARRRQRHWHDPNVKKKEHGSKTPAPQDWPFLQGGWSYAPAETCQATRRLPISWHHEHVTKDPQKYSGKQATKKKKNDSDWGLRRRSFSARCRWLEPSRSKSVSHPTLQTLVVVEESLSKPSSRHRGYTDPATLNDWWANEAHQHWAWEWDFYLEV